VRFGCRERAAGHDRPSRSELQYMHERRAAMRCAFDRTSASVVFTPIAVALRRTRSHAMRVSFRGDDMSRGASITNSAAALRPQTAGSHAMIPRTRAPEPRPFVQEPCSAVFAPRGRGRGSYRLASLAGERVVTRPRRATQLRPRTIRRRPLSPQGVENSATTSFATVRHQEAFADALAKVSLSHASVAPDAYGFFTHIVAT